MPVFTPDDVDFSGAWIDREPGARRRSGTVFGASAGAERSGCSLLEVPAGALLPRRTDSADETIVVVAGTASVGVGDAPAFEVPAGGVALVPADVPHVVRNATDGQPLRFAAPEVVTTYEQPVQPGGERERRSAS